MHRQARQKMAEDATQSWPLLPCLLGLEVQENSTQTIDQNYEPQINACCFDNRPSDHGTVLVSGGGSPAWADRSFTQAADLPGAVSTDHGVADEL